MPLTTLYRFIANRLSPAGPKAQLSILIYHRVLPEFDPIFPSEPNAIAFDAQLRALMSVFDVIPLPEAVAKLRDGTLPARAACITFDDGYADNRTIALPILQKHGLPATFFVATAYLNGGRMFNDTVIEAIRRARGNRIDLGDMGLGKHDVSTPQAKARAIENILPKVKYLALDEREAAVAELARRVTDEPLPDDLMMTTDQLRFLHAAGMEIGGHTHRHPILAKLDRDAARSEIAAGKAWLETALGCRVRVFAYPNGKPGVDYLPDQASIISELGIEAAVSTQWGSARQDSDPYQLPRFTPWTTSLSRFVPQLLRNLGQPAASTEPSTPPNPA